MLKPVMMLAAGTIGLAVMVPGFVPDEPREPVEREDNIIRQSEDSGFFNSAPKQAATKPKSYCYVDGDLGVSVCPQEVSQRSRKKKVTKKVAARKGSSKKSSNKNRGRSYVIDQDQQGHFRTTARMNGVRIPVLVDTGATAIAINKTTARRLGLNLGPKDFKHKAKTANGTATYAIAEINNVRIGGIVFDNVEASVLDDRALSTTLLGMSFLKRLTKFQMESGQFKMVQ